MTKQPNTSMKRPVRDLGVIAISSALAVLFSIFAYMTWDSDHHNFTNIIVAAALMVVALFCLFTAIIGNKKTFLAVMEAIAQMLWTV